MRTLLMVLMIAGLMSTVGVYAAGFGATPTTKTLAGSSDITVSSSTSGVTATTVKWRTDSNNKIDAAKVTWTPQAAGDYDIVVAAGGQTGTLNVPSSGATERVDDIVPLAAAVEASAVTTAKVVIEEN